MWSENDAMFSGQSVYVLEPLHVAVHDKTGTLTTLFERLQKHFPILVPAEDRLPPVAPAHDVIERSLILDPWRSWHSRTMDRPFCSRQNNLHVA